MPFGKNIFYWTTANGSCPTVTDSVLIEVDDIVRFNGFSPNNDGVNDTWEITAGDPDSPVPMKDLYPNAIVEVFSRWGTLVFRSEPGYSNPWNGNYLGRPLPLDSYYYVINPKNGSQPIKGVVTIVK